MQILYSQTMLSAIHICYFEISVYPSKKAGADNLANMKYLLFNVTKMVEKVFLGIFVYLPIFTTILLLI